MASAILLTDRRPRVGSSGHHAPNLRVAAARDAYRRRVEAEAREEPIPAMPAPVWEVEHDPGLLNGPLTPLDPCHHSSRFAWLALAIGALLGLVVWL